MMRREVSVEEYANCVADGGCRTANFYSKENFGRYRPDAGQVTNGNWQSARLDHPMNSVRFADAARFCSAQGGRLPTVAEWQCAATNNSTTRFPWGDAPPSNSRVNSCNAGCVEAITAPHSDPETLRASIQRSEGDDGYPGTAPVGSFPAGRSLWGLDDLLGNVEEWLADEDVCNPADEECRVAPRHWAAGGSWTQPLNEIEQQRLRDKEDDSFSKAVGFRCIK